MIGSVPSCSYNISTMHQNAPIPASPYFIITACSLGSFLAL
nr:MAG TPA: hypothetical protein [Caudoviricetes sp.]DAR22069.1 MAG TPA: hypothetical protein [Caudoviricetes sp.]